VDHALTEEMRTSSLPYFIGLRRALAARGIDPLTSALAESYEDDANLEHVVLALGDGRIFEFDYRYEEDELDRGQITTWVEIPREWSSLADRSEVLAALRFLGLSIDL
jgi:hypothetical protein